MRLKLMNRMILIFEMMKIVVYELQKVFLPSLVQSKF